MSNGTTHQKDTPTTDFTQCLNRKDTPMYPVIDMNLNDVVEDIRIILDGSAVAVDGITATAEPNPSYRPGDTPGNETHLLVTFTDESGRRRVAEVKMTAYWVEDTCWDLRLAEGTSSDECEDCGRAL